MKDSARERSGSITHTLHAMTSRTKARLRGPKDDKPKASNLTHIRRDDDFDDDDY